MVSPHAAGAPSREWTGFALVAFSAVALGSSPSLSRIVLDSGGSAELLGFVRCGVAALLAAAMLALRERRGPRCERGAWPVLLTVGLLLGLQSFIYPAAVTHAPVSVVVVIFFLFPAFVGVLGWLMLGEPLTRIRILGLVLGLGGVMLIAGAVTGEARAIGLVFAFVAAVVTAVAIVLGARLSRGGGVLDFTALAQGVAAGAVALGALVGAGFGGAGLAPPATAQGWWALALAGLLFAAGILAFFAAIAMIDAVRAATIANLEPVWAVCLAMLLFGEAFNAPQGLGAAMVIAAAMLGPLFDRKRPEGTR